MAIFRGRSGMFALNLKNSFNCNSSSLSNLVFLLILTLCNN